MNEDYLITFKDYTMKLNYLEQLRVQFTQIYDPTFHLISHDCGKIILLTAKFTLSNRSYGNNDINY